MKKIYVAIFLAFLVINANCQYNPAYPFRAKGKKIIEMGWDMPTARFIKNNTAEMQKSPFDGLVFSPAQTIIYPWELENWQQTNRIDTANLLAIEWGSLKNSFLNLWSGDESGFSYFNDSHWVTILDNMKNYARLAKKCGIDGICFDVEFYSSKSPWSYTDHGEGHTLAETKAKVRQRGAQIMSAFQGAYPNIKILSMYMLSYVPAKWELLPDFVNGMLDVITTAELIEGHEGTYYLNGTSDYFGSYNDVRTTYRNQRCASENYGKYNSNMQAGVATYDAVVLTSNPASDNMKKRWEHNHYMGLVSCDEYLWVYTEKFAFWNNPDDRPEGNPVSYPPWAGAVEAIASAKNKYNNQQALGWDIVNGVVKNSVPVSLTPSTTRISTAPGSVTINVTAASGRVDLYQNMQKIQSKSSSPYEFYVSNMDSGTYEFIAHVVTSNATGTSNPSIVTVAGDTLAPSTPSLVNVTDIEAMKCKLHLSPSTDEVAVTGYEVFKDGISMSTTVDTSIVINGLTCNTDYWFTVKAKDFAGNWSDLSTPVNVRTSECDTVAPDAPLGLDSVSVSSFSFILTWNSSPDNMKTVGYDVFKDGIKYTTTTDTSLTVKEVLPSTAYSMTVKAKDISGNISNSSEPLVITTHNCSMLNDWEVAEIGAAKQNACESNGVFEIEGAGADIWGKADQFIYTYKPLNGNAVIIAKVESLENSNAWAKSGVMIRENLTAGAKFADCMVTPSNGVAFQLRASANSDCVGHGLLAAITAPYWLKLERVGNMFSAYCSADGDIWVPIGTSILVKMATQVYVGLAVTSHVANVTCKTVISNVSISSSPDIEKPSTPTGLSASLVTSSGFALNWTASTDNFTIAEYDIFQDGTLIGTSGTSSMAITGLICDSTYSMTIQAKDESNNWSELSAALDVTTPICTGIDSKEYANGLQIYPNPSNSTLTIANILQNADIKIIRGDGKIVSQFKTSNNKVLLDVHKWLKGLYLISITTDKGGVVKKMIVE